MRLSGSQGAAEAHLGGCGREAGGRLLGTARPHRGGGETPHLVRTRILAGGFWQLLSLWPSPRLLTLAGRLNGDLLAAVAPAGGGNGGHPQQVLLSPVQVGDPVEELPRTCLILARGLWGGGEDALRTKALGLQLQCSWGALGSDDAMAGLGVWNRKQDPA